MKIVDVIRNAIRGVMRRVAVGLNALSGGRLHPTAVTLFGFAMHVPIALLIASRDNLWAAVLLIVFGLFDALDGELARLQGRASVRGMLLDASTDRMKEVLLYTGAAYALVHSDHPSLAVWAVAACGASLCVSYVKAKGEAAVATARKQLSHHELNHLFSGELLRFEVRMVLLIIGLLCNQLAAAVIVIAVLSALTAFWRLVRISRQV